MTAWQGIYAVAVEHDFYGGPDQVCDGFKWYRYAQTHGHLQHITLVFKNWVYKYKSRCDICLWHLHIPDAWMEGKHFKPGHQSTMWCYHERLYAKVEISDMHFK